jgi:hypothetical protein
MKRCVRNCGVSIARFCQPIAGPRDSSKHHDIANAAAHIRGLIDASRCKSVSQPAIHPTERTSRVVIPHSRDTPDALEALKPRYQRTRTSFNLQTIREEVEDQHGAPLADDDVAQIPGIMQRLWERRWGIEPAASGGGSAMRRYPSWWCRIARCRRLRRRTVPRRR